MAGWAAPVSMLVTCRTAPGRPSPSMAAAKRLGMPVRSEDHSRVRPSGDQTGPASTARSSVTLATSPPASSRITTSKRPPERHWDAAMRAPSGDQRGKAQCTAGSASVNGLTSPVAGSTRTNRLVPPPLLHRHDLVAIRMHVREGQPPAPGHAGHAAVRVGPVEIGVQAVPVHQLELGERSSPRRASTRRWTGRWCG